MALGRLNSRPSARGSQEARSTQLRDHLMAHLCTLDCNVHPLAAIVYRSAEVLSHQSPSTVIQLMYMYYTLNDRTMSPGKGETAALGGD